MVACPSNIVYGTSKAAAVYMTKQIAVDVRPRGVAPHLHAVVSTHEGLELQLLTMECVLESLADSTPRS